MKPLIPVGLLLCASFAQSPLSQMPPTLPPPPGSGNDTRFPNGKMQRDEIARADHKKNVEDAAELLKLAEELKADFDKGSAFVVSVKAMKKTEDIEKLARNIRGRLKRY